MKRRPSCPLPKSTPFAPKKNPNRDAPPPPMTPDEAMAEARRCLSLNECEECEVCMLMCPDQAITKDPETKKAVIDLRYCKGCGLCAHLCPKRAILMVPDGN